MFDLSTAPNATTLNPTFPLPDAVPGLDLVQNKNA